MINSISEEDILDESSDSDEVSKHTGKKKSHSQEELPDY
jgi:hypothetical protein